MLIRRNPWLRLLYVMMLLPITAIGMGFVLFGHAFHESGWSDPIVAWCLSLLSIGLGVYCWNMTWEWCRDMCRFGDAYRAVKRGEFVLEAERSRLPEIEDLARELGRMNESPDTSLVKWIVLSRDHQDIFVRLVEAMSASMKCKSFYERGHSGRVAEYATLICREFGLNDHETERIRFSALLHDIGKIGMDQKILTKPSELTPAEFAILKTHPSRGAEMLRPVGAFADLLPGIELHHESLDGTGYPHGLRHGEIPIMARIIAVADAFDAMTHNRTYQNAMDGSYALRLIRTMAGRKFDERAVNALGQAYAAGLIVLPERTLAADEDLAVSPPIEVAHTVELEVPAVPPKDAEDTSSLVGVSRN